MNFLRRLLKLRHMPADEIRRRVGHALQIRRDRRRFRAGEEAYKREFAKSSPVLEPARLAAIFLPGAQLSNHRQVSETFREDFTTLQLLSGRRAECVFSDSYRLLGHTVDLSATIDWHRDFGSAHRWPDTFHADIPLYEHGDGVDVKRVWELGRHQFLVAAASAVAIGNLRPDDRRAQAARIRNILLNWIDRNPVHAGIHWTSGLEVALRLISWIWTLALLSEHPPWREGDLPRISRSLAEHALYLEHYLSFDSSPYNHLMGEATGLYLAGLSLEPWPVARRFRELGRQVLIEHASRQFHEDGFSVEQAMSYHFFTLGFLTMAICAARREGKPLTEVERVAHQAFRAGAVFRRPDATWPAIGDLDSARSIPATPEEFWNFDSLCHLAAVLFDDSMLKFDDAFCGEELFWLTGCEGVAHFRRMTSESNPARAVVLDDSGYAVASREGEPGAGGEHLVFDAGPISAGLHPDATPSTAHGHADVLSLLYYAEGKGRLCDSGIPFYYGPAQWVEHFRSPAAHNTIEIEGVKMVRPAGRLAWSHAPQRPRLDANLSEEAWLARGCAVWSEGVRVERSLLVLPGMGLFVADLVDADRSRCIQWHWQLPETGMADGLLSSAIRWHSGIDNTLLAMWSDRGTLQTELTRAAIESPIAWQAPEYGTMKLGSCLTARLADTRKVLVCTFLGRGPIRFRVTVGELQLQGTLGIENEECRTFKREALEQQILTPPLPNSEITWTVTTPSFAATYCAGMNIVPPSAGMNIAPPSSKWKRLNGAGTWPAYCTLHGPLAPLEMRAEGINLGV